VKTVLLKLDESVHTLWVSAAKHEKLSLSEWIREQCNGNVNEPDESHDAGRTRGASLRKRRASVAPAGEHTVSGAFEAVNSTNGLVTPSTPFTSVLAHAPNCSCGLCANKRKSVKK
jgi:hypothetical protein